MQPADRLSRPRGVPSHLESQVSYRLHAPLIYVKGELDHDSVGQLRPVIDEELRDEPAVLLLDLSELTYMDSGGLALMFEVVQRVRPPRWVGVVAPNQGIARLLEMTGLADADTFRVFPDQKTVAAALTSG